MSEESIQYLRSLRNCRLFFSRMRIADGDTQQSLRSRFRGISAKRSRSLRRRRRKAAQSVKARIAQIDGLHRLLRRTGKPAGGCQRKTVSFGEFPKRSQMGELGHARRFAKPENLGDDFWTRFSSDPRLRLRSRRSTLRLAFRRSVRVSPAHLLVLRCRFGRLCPAHESPLRQLGDGLDFQPCLSRTPPADSPISGCDIADARRNRDDDDAHNNVIRDNRISSNTLKTLHPQRLCESFIR